MNNPKSNDKEPVLLMCPRQGAKQGAPSNQRSVSPKVCAIGGVPTYYNLVCYENPTCDVCNSTMFLIAQIYAPLEGLDRTLYVFGCNRGKCSSIDGSFKCIRDQREVCSVNNSDRNSGQSEENLNEVDDSEDDDDSWNCDDNADFDSELEAMMVVNELKQLELKDKVDGEKRKINLLPEKVTKDVHYSGLTPADACFLPQQVLELYNESFDNSLKGNTNDDNDFIGVYDCDDSMKDKLKKYLEDEDDPDIVSSINQSLAPSNIGFILTDGNGNYGESDERLPRNKRIFLEFIERIKLNPSQVVRYIYDGIPLWSTPIDIKSYEDSSGKYRNSKTIPSCESCGMERSFEFQLMPSLLHILQVDEYSNFGKECDDVANLFQSKEGGMSWGVIAVYSCPESCLSHTREEYVVVQDPMDGDAKKPPEQDQDLRVDGNE